MKHFHTRDWEITVSELLEPKPDQKVIFYPKTLSFCDFSKENVEPIMRPLNPDPNTIFVKVLSKTS